MTRIHFLAAAIACALPATALADAQFIIVNIDGPGEGFNDATPATPAGGNPGTTVGAQRLNAFQFAADRWGEILDSTVPIHIRAAFNPLTCTATGAVLGSAGAVTVHANFPNAPAQNTWFNGALANKLAGLDLEQTADTPEINAQFNSSLNGDPACLGGASWYYGFDNNEGVNQTDLIPVLMHEFGHGLGFQSFVSGATGALFQGLPDQYLIYMFDNQTSKLWRSMTNAERQTSALNARHVVWNGPTVLGEAEDYLAAGTAGLTVTAPASIAGRYTVGEASFGPRLASTSLTGTVKQSRDNDGVLTGCVAYPAGTFATQRIALIDRGICGFAIKVKNAQDAGALAVIIADNAPGTPPPGMSGVDATITIPSIRVTLNDGNAIKAQLVAGVTVDLLLDLSVPSGADTALRPFLNTPNPLVGGSSISHFDPATFPNTLMEPAINSDLTANVDLTLPLFRDIGWYADGDLDLVDDAADNCVNVTNSDQADRNDDGAGDVCDDEDSDGVIDASDNCADASNSDQANADGDALGNACDEDDDNDGVLDAADNCTLVENPGQENDDGDAEGDACDGDLDGDGDPNAADNCPDIANAGQEDLDGDGAGDVCDLDDDGDTVVDTQDNCAIVPNLGQENTDGDTDGDACDADDDNDGDADVADNCALVANADQLDSDMDAQGDVCDIDDDADGVLDTVDNCVLVKNLDQDDADGDKKGNICDEDDDNDGKLDAADNCPLVSNTNQADEDGDGTGDACDPDFGDGDGDDGGGCCSTSKRNTPPIGSLLLGLAVVVGLRRRRRQK